MPLFQNALATTKTRPDKGMRSVVFDVEQVTERRDHKNAPRQFNVRTRHSPISTIQNSTEEDDIQESL